MKVSNFTLKETKGSGLNTVYIATVDVEIGFIFKQKSTVEVRRRIGDNWFFSNTGEWCPGYKVNDLARAWFAKTGEEC